MYLQMSIKCENDLPYLRVGVTSVQKQPTPSLRFSTNNRARKDGVSWMQIDIKHDKPRSARESQTTLRALLTQLTTFRGRW